MKARCKKLEDALREAQPDHPLLQQNQSDDNAELPPIYNFNKQGEKFRVKTEEFVPVRAMPKKSTGNVRIASASMQPTH